MNDLTALADADLDDLAERVAAEVSRRQTLALSLPTAAALNARYLSATGETQGGPWVRPTGAHDAYQTGDRVTPEGQVYESLIDANTWSPTEYPAGWAAAPDA